MFSFFNNLNFTTSSSFFIPSHPITHYSSIREVEGWSTMPSHLLNFKKKILLLLWLKHNFWHFFKCRFHHHICTFLFSKFNQLRWWQHYEKKVFCNWPCNSIFELHWIFTTHCIYTMWMLMDKLHELQSYNSLYIWCNSLQLNCY
jgi:hypothetical protein